MTTDTYHSEEIQWNRSNNKTIAISFIALQQGYRVSNSNSKKGQLPNCTINLLLSRPGIEPVTNNTQEGCSNHQSTDPSLHTIPSHPLPPDTTSCQRVLTKIVVKFMRNRNHCEPNLEHANCMDHLPKLIIAFTCDCEKSHTRN